MSKSEYLIVPKGTKFTGSGELGLTPSTPAWNVSYSQQSSMQHVAIFTNVPTTQSKTQGSYQL